MKKIVLMLFLVTCTMGYSQEEKQIDFQKNEIKGNALFLVLGGLEVTYERLLTQDAALGVSVFYVNVENSDRNFSLVPYYRAYFGGKKVAGFFVEGFSMINSGVNTSGANYDVNGYVDGKRIRYTDFALGFGLGSKWVHKRGYVFEINGGIGRNLLSKDSPEVVARGGITLGYRF